MASCSTTTKSTWPHSAVEPLPVALASHFVSRLYCLRVPEVLSKTVVWRRHSRSRPCSSELAVQKEEIDDRHQAAARTPDPHGAPGHGGACPPWASCSAAGWHGPVRPGLRVVRGL